MKRIEREIEEKSVPTETMLSAQRKSFRSSIYSMKPLKVVSWVT